MTQQLDLLLQLPPAEPSFDGSSYVAELDAERLGAQLRAVRDLMQDGRWRTLAEIACQVHAPEASVSARLRDLRKPRFGEWSVDRRRRGEEKRGLHEYRLIERTQ